MTITIEQQQAIDEYASKVGKGWREELSFDWMRAGSQHVSIDTYTYLHQIRNQHGPSKLAKITPTKHNQHGAKQ